MFSVFFFREGQGFASVRGMVVLSREARPCLLENKKNIYIKSGVPKTIYGPAQCWGGVYASFKKSLWLMPKPKIWFGSLTSLCTGKLRFSIVSAGKRAALCLAYASPSVRSRQAPGGWEAITSFIWFFHIFSFHYFYFFCDDLVFDCCKYPK